MEEKIHTKAVVNVSRGAKRRDFFGENEKRLVGNYGL